MPTSAPTPTAVVVAPTPTPAAMMAEHFDPFEFAAANGERPRRGGIMKGAAPSNVNHYDLTQGFAALMVMATPLYNGILMSNPYDWTSEALPDLAHSWDTSADGLKITFHLHEGVEWHDGVAFTAADAKWSLERVLLDGLVDGATDNEGHSFFGNNSWPLYFESFEAPDDKTLVVNVVNAGAQGLAIGTLRDGFSKILPRHIGKDDPVNAFKTHQTLIGTGPMRIVGEVSTVLAVQERNPDYFKPDLPWTDGYEVHTILEPSVRATAVRTERVFMDGANGLPFQYYEPAKAIAAQDPGLIHQVNAGLWPVNFNWVLKRPMDDIRIRQAFAEALDLSQFVAVDTATGKEGLGVHRGVIGTAIPPWSKWAPPKEVSETFIGHGPDMEVRRDNARRLMAEYQAEQDTPFDFSQGPGTDCGNAHVSCDVAELMQSNLKTIGVDFPIRPGDIAAQFGKFVEGSSDSLATYTVIQSDSPTAYFGEVYLDDAVQNFFKHTVDGLRELYERQLYLPDDEKLAIAWEMDRLVQADAAQPALFWGAAEHLMRDYVKGYSPSPGYYDSFPAFEYLWLDLPELALATPGG